MNSPARSARHGLFRRCPAMQRGPRRGRLVALLVASALLLAACGGGGDGPLFGNGSTVFVSPTTNRLDAISTIDAAQVAAIDLVVH